MFYELRKKAKLSQTQIAISLGVKPQTVNMWENGKSTPNIHLLRPLAKVLKVNVDTVLKCFE